MAAHDKLCKISPSMALLFLGFCLSIAKAVDFQILI